MRFGREVWIALREALEPKTGNPTLDSLAAKIDAHTSRLDRLEQHIGIGGATEATDDLGAHGI